MFFNNNKTASVFLKSNNCLIDFSNINLSITSIQVIATIQNNKSFSQISSINITLNDSISFDLNNLTDEKSVILFEFYRKDLDWKIKVIGNGYNSGLEKIAENYGLDLSKLSETERKNKFRRSSNEVIDELKNNIKNNLQKLILNINEAILNKYSESDTRMILDRIFIDVLNYSINDVKTEQKIQGCKADYILSTSNIDYIVVEVKKAGMPLREKQIFQATSYGAYSGIKWALLTNLQDWQLYYVNTAEKVEPELIFKFNILENSKENLEFLFAISKNGVTRKNILKNYRDKSLTLSQANIISTILTEDVLIKIRTTINKNSDYKVTNDEIQNILEEMFNF